MNSRAGAAPTEAVVLCTRNRPGDLKSTLLSLRRLPRRAHLLVVVMDASDADAALQNEAATLAPCGGPARYRRFRGRPSLTRQRNAAVRHLPASVEIVHFIDDDVTVLPGYFAHLARTLRTRPGVAGAGGLVLEPGRSAAPVTRWHRALLLRSAVPGRVTRAGFATSAQQPPCPAPRRTQWLNGCASYQRSVFERHRFDARLDGYALFEDLDFSYRVGQREGPLLVEPRARLLHHCSLANRHDRAAFMETATVHRYWFLEKNDPRPTRRAAFWWSVAGRALLLRLSPTPSARDALAGLLRGARAVLARRHPLLKKTAGNGRQTVTKPETLNPKR